MIRDETTRMVVLDDDPTGIQTVHGCRLLTSWDVKTVREALRDKVPFFYMLTNTRAMTQQETSQVIEVAMETVIEANRECGFRMIYVSRSDSCLRGHFPLETDVMQHVLRRHGIEIWHPVPFIPAFIEAGRVTVGGTHFMRENGRLVPLSQTEFANDNVFGYTTSVLCEYIREKGANPDDYEIVDAENYGQLSAYTGQLLAQTASFDGAVVIRSSSSLPKAISGISEQPLLGKEIIRNKSGVGCFVVGSHVQKTTRQLKALLSADGIRGIEVDVMRILDEDKQLFGEILSQMSEAETGGYTPVVYTSRQEIRLSDAGQRQKLGKTVSDFLVSLVAEMPFIPSYLVAKGGITSHDILTKGLHVRSATVLGQIVANVPCVMTDRFPYIIFPGNVGDDNSLRDVYEQLR